MIVIDANIMASALMGKSLPLLARVALQVSVVAPEAQIAETRGVLARRSQSDVTARMAALLDIVEPIEMEAFEQHEAEARTRLHARGQSAWPVLAAAIALDADIWSNDRDFFGVGVPVWSSGNMQHASSDWADDVG